MPIAFNCTCGKTLRVPDTSAGKRAKCPACGAIGLVPEPEPEFEVVDEPPVRARHAEAPSALPELPNPKPKPKPKPSEGEDEEESDGNGATYGLADNDGGSAPGTSRSAGGRTSGKRGGLPNFRKGRDKHS